MNKFFLIIILSYLIGSISGSLLLGKIWNVDIRKHGSKSAGGTNALRTVGIVFALLTLVIDVAKGLAFMCSEESGLMSGSIIDFDQTVHGWHSYSAYDTNILDDSLLGE